MEEIVENQPQLDANETTELLRPDPQLLTMMLGTVITCLEQDGEAKDTDVVYLVVKEYLSSVGEEKTFDQLVQASFAYYVEVYAALHLTRSASNHTAMSLFVFRNNAVLSLFDLYLSDPDVHAVRRMLPLASSALHEVAASLQSIDTDRPMLEVIDNLSTLALLTQTVSIYVKGAGRRRNCLYIKWLHDLLQKVVLHHDLSFMKNDNILKKVVDQVRNNERFITVPLTSV